MGKMLSVCTNCFEETKFYYSGWPILSECESLIRVANFIRVGKFVYIAKNIFNGVYYFLNWFYLFLSKCLEKCMLFCDKSNLHC